MSANLQDLLIFNLKGIAVVAEASKTASIEVPASIPAFVGQARLHLGVKGIRLGPTLPAFVSPGVLNVLVENFDIKAIIDLETDIATMMAGK